jgi:type II secretory pathway pseudopilin PulG
VEIMIVVAIIGLLAAVAIPNFIRARESAQADTCIGNLRQLDGAVQQWALENSQNTSSPVELDDIRPYIGRVTAGQLPDCPGGGAYEVTDVGTKPRCTIGNTALVPHVLPL